jgi:putative tryptophan/tyrosine transport system substrate-binding protein
LRQAEAEIERLQEIIREEKPQTWSFETLLYVGRRLAETYPADIFDGSSGDSGLIVTASQFGTNHPRPLAALAARHKLPAVYPFRYYASAGGLISYGPDQLDEYHRAAAYVDRILKGEKPADLPVQVPVKYELAINLKTAKVLGLDVPPTLIARADEVIE